MSAAAQAPWPRIETLIPHRAPLLLVDRIVAVLDDGVVCRGRVPGPRPGDGRAGASVFLGLELAAQAAAVDQALRHGRGEGAPVVGFLASIRNAVFHVPVLPAGEPLVATVRSVGSVPPLAMYAVRVVLEETASELLSATLSTWSAAAQS